MKFICINNYEDEIFNEYHALTVGKIYESIDVVYEHFINILDMNETCVSKCTDEWYERFLHRKGIERWCCLIKNDGDYEVWYSCGEFKKLDEVRDEKLNK